MGGFQQRPWTPTKRRGPIAAEYKSPGPACVNLQSTIGKIFCNPFGIYNNNFPQYVTAYILTNFLWINERLTYHSLLRLSV